MIDITRFITGLFGWLGWQQGYRPKDPLLIGDILTSDSGRFFNSMTNTLELETLKAIGPEFDLFGYPDYLAGTAYVIGDNVTLNDNTYKSLTNANIGNDPETDEVNWESNFTKWLKDKTKNSIYTLAQNIASIKQLTKNTKAILDQVHLFDSSGNTSNQIVKSGRIVGFTFKLQFPADMMTGKDALVMMLQKVGVQFASVQTDFKIYLFHTSQGDQPIGTLTISGNSVNRFQWYTFQQSMPFLEDYNAGGEFKLVYYEDDLVGNAIEYKLDNTGLNGCSTCNNGMNKSSIWYEDYSKWMTFQAFFINAADIPVTPLQLWNTEDEMLVNNQNFGLNIQIDIRCDITDIILRNKDVFTNAILLQMRKDMAQEIISNTRTNDNENDATRSAFLALEGGERDLKSLSKDLEDEIIKMNFNLSDLGSPCFTCSDEGGIVLTYA